jgi:hypothetical protein
MERLQRQPAAPGEFGREDLKKRKQYVLLASEEIDASRGRGANVWLHSIDTPQQITSTAFNVGDRCLAWAARLGTASGDFTIR